MFTAIEVGETCDVVLLLTHSVAMPDWRTHDCGDKTLSPYSVNTIQFLSTLKVPKSESTLPPPPCVPTGFFPPCPLIATLKAALSLSLTGQSVFLRTLFSKLLNFALPSRVKD